MEDLRGLGGHREGDVFFVHSSLSRVRCLEGGTDTVDALLEVLGPECTPLMPVFTIFGFAVLLPIFLGIALTLSSKTTRGENFDRPKYLGA